MPGTLKLSNSSSAASKASASYGNVAIGGISIPGYSVATPAQNTTRLLLYGGIALLGVVLFIKMK